MLDDDAFARLVAEEVKNRVSDAQRDYLKLPENWGRWQRCLVALEQNLSNQLAEIHRRQEADTARYRSMGEHGVRLLAEVLSEAENRTRKIERFKFHVDTRLDEVTRMIGLGSDAIEEKAQTVDFLREAIERHHFLFAKFGLVPTKLDEALWAAVDGHWEFDDITEEDMDV